ncbi:hypothetical protein ORV05_31335 [Amycolatopsis cynarae]|uniref:Uncharacterized protein n=1 Tax=Amycolatopsis cynarae TaxID=2995223 RepID=A0ABY7AZ86_9PSEU|nr:hypothetical protein [Amycolatopsis sp. HUAS 11-8]WAL65344.1 hypothetical protein ORV05_31335 [Amycolatopsis sp. HUAS 11-8]
MTMSETERPVPDEESQPNATPPDPLGPPRGNWEPFEPPPVENGRPTPPVVNAGNDGEVPPMPPVVELAGDGGGGPPEPAAQPGGVWVKDRVITHLWSSSGSPGVWAFVAGLGWKRLESSETGRSPLTTLALLAKANGLPVSYHEDGAGQIDQLLL